MLCEAGQEIPYPEDDRLFIDNHVYRAGFREETSICGYYSSNPERRRQGYNACMELITSREGQPLTRKTALANSRFYVRTAAELYAGFCARELPPMDDVPGYTPMNPSLAWHDGRLVGIVRFVNYAISREGYYHIRDADKTIKTPTSSSNSTITSPWRAAGKYWMRLTIVPGSPQAYRASRIAGCFPAAAGSGPVVR